MTIYPTIFTTSKEQLRHELELAKDIFSIVQIDIADGVLVENKTINLNDALQVLEEFPLFEYDIHLMVHDYRRSLDLLALSQSRIRYALIHLKAMPDPQLFTNQHSQRFKIGLVINPDESFETISQTYNVQNIAAIQIMTVYPGAQGRPFEANALNFIDQLADMHYEGEIILDGAINDETLPQILKRQNKPTFIGPGSYFSKAQSPEEYKQKYEKLQTILREKTE